ncbi:hypothetical protein XENOCAPTIV_003555 [Xenoophorus captivus]|uniref:Uncharacterized protein n=1 Tax=Xenoophorus captivus TaxID=1517983 RepID=A0ABV0R6P0_9TELE
MGNKKNPKKKTPQAIYMQIKAEAFSAFTSLYALYSFVYSLRILTTTDQNIHSSVGCFNALQSCSAHHAACIRWLILNRERCALALAAWNSHCENVLGACGGI